MPIIIIIIIIIIIVVVVVVVVTDFLKELLSNGSINTQRPNRSNNRRKIVFSVRLLAKAI
jgi:flagellar basal body-associated protein FliL